MRSYKLTVGVYTFELNDKNPNAPRLTFSINAYSDASLYTPSVITIYNPSTAMFSNSSYFIGKTLTLTAGFKNSVLFQKAGLTKSQNDLLFHGSVIRCVPNFTGLDTSISFYVASFNEKGLQYEEVLSKGDKIVSKLQTLLKKVIDNPSIKVNADVGTLALIFKSKESMSLKASGVSEVLNFAKRFNLVATLENNAFKFYKSDSPFITEVKPFKPVASDFLTQPSWEKITSISCTFNLRGDLRVGQKLILPNNLVTNLTPLLSNNSLAGVNYKPHLIFGGVYTIITIIHVGDSRSVDAQSWSSSVEAIKEGENLGL